MDRNFFVNDPDAFTVSKQTLLHPGTSHVPPPLTLSDAQVSIALAAVAGGMFEIGDDLPTLGADPDRLALVENHTLIDMVRLGRAATPVDLMSYSDADQQSSIFMLREGARQSILTVFNWTDRPRTHTFELRNLGLSGNGKYVVSNVLAPSESTKIVAGSLSIAQPPHSVRMYKLVDSIIPEVPPSVRVERPVGAIAGKTVKFAASSADSVDPVVAWHWDMGDGVDLTGPSVDHAYTHSGVYTVTLVARGVDGVSRKVDSKIRVTGSLPTNFTPDGIKRYKGSSSPLHACCEH